MNMDNRSIDANDPPCQEYYIILFHTGIINENDYLLLRGEEFSMIRVNDAFVMLTITVFVRQKLTQHHILFPITEFHGLKSQKILSW